MIDHTELISRVIQASNWVTLGSSMPSVLIETGYLSDINDEKYLSSEKVKMMLPTAYLMLY